jgi:VIT1/CCC1 family predicted Fe2+/Mn2+ transporter
MNIRWLVLDLRARIAQVEPLLSIWDERREPIEHCTGKSARLGRDILREAIAAAVLSSVSRFLGALTPLTIAVLVPGNCWAAVLVALVGLALLGLGVARAVSGNLLYWSTTLVVGGIALCVLGVKLRIL